MPAINAWSLTYEPVVNRRFDFLEAHGNLLNAAEAVFRVLGRLKRVQSNDPPAEPEAFRLLAPQRGLIATAQKQISRPKLSFSRKRTAGPANRSLISLESDRREPQIPGTVKLLLPPRQSRGVSHRTR